MLIKSEKGISGVDIMISIIAMMIFIALIINLTLNINRNSDIINKEAIATSYAIREIETIKALGIEEYAGDGVNAPEVTEADIYVTDENENNVFTGYHKKITVEDYVYFKHDNTKTQDLVKKIVVDISYKVGVTTRTVSISTYITKE